MAKSMKNGKEEDELMLELSIGGIFEKPNKRIASESLESIQRGDRIEDVEVRTRRRLQAALRRRDWRRKREEKMKKPVDFGRFTMDNDVDLEPVCKKERIGSLLEDIGLNSAVSVTNGFVNRKVIPVVGDDVNNKKNCVLLPYDMNSDDSRSNSCNSQLDQQLASCTSGATTDPHNQPTGSSKQTAPTTKLTTSTIPGPSPMNPHDSSTVSNPHYKPKTYSIQHQQDSFLAPVSTTGNGPNGKTISGFLYRYTKGHEVSIVCVCHGHLFTPAGFVEHAGGVDIAHPLKHITIFPNAFAS